MPAINDLKPDFVVIVGTVLFLCFCLLFVLFLFFFRQKQLKNLAEQQALREAFEQELLRAQVEIQNQTLRQVGEDLHDDVGQLLTVARIELNSLDAPPAAVDRANEALQVAIQAIRSMSKTLDSEALSTFSLQESLNLELDRIRRTGRFVVHFTVTGTPRPLPQNGQVVLFRMMQEVLNNAMKHSGGTRLEVSLTYTSGALRAQLVDNGQGFDQQAAEQRALTHSGSGLRHLRRRCELLGGTCRVESAPGAGTSVTIDVPVL
jgi:two-component system NarL family sensor kinase